MVQSILSAKDDERIRGLVLNLNDFEGGDLPSLEYVGKAIQSFKESQKPVIAYADNYTQSQYFLASFADEILSQSDLDKSASRFASGKSLLLNPARKT